MAKITLIKKKYITEEQCLERGTPWCRDMTIVQR